MKPDMNQPGKGQTGETAFSKNVQNPLQQELLNTIDRFKSSLQALKSDPGLFLDLSPESRATLASWSDSVPDGEETLFFFEGRPESRIYILDSHAGFFTGAPGELLIKILSAMTLTPDQVFICNTDDMSKVRQVIAKHRPEAVITLGSKAGKALLDTREPLESFQGKSGRINGIRVMPTFHPALLVKAPEYKRRVWEDMKQVMAWTGLG